MKKSFIVTNTKLANKVESEDDRNNALVIKFHRSSTAALKVRLTREEEKIAMLGQRKKWERERNTNGEDRWGRKFTLFFGSHAIRIPLHVSQAQMNQLFITSLCCTPPTPRPFFLPKVVTLDRVELKPSEELTIELTCDVSQWGRNVSVPRHHHYFTTYPHIQMHQYKHTDPAVDKTSLPKGIILHDSHNDNKIVYNISRSNENFNCPGYSFVGYFAHKLPIAFDDTKCFLKHFSTILSFKIKSLSNNVQNSSPKVELVHPSYTFA